MLLIDPFFPALAQSLHAATPNMDWSLIGGNEFEQHFSPLDQISEANVARLGIAWFADMPTPDGMVGTPLMVDGVVYQSGSHSIIYANDLKSGALLWTYDPQVKGNGAVMASAGALTNRGMALWKDLALVGTGDCRLIAVDRKTGTQRWETQACDSDGERMISGAPRVGADKVFIGNANGDAGTRRGHVDAFDARTGRHLWRFYTIPGDPAKGFESPALARAAKTWGKEWWKKVGGGSVWEGLNFDPTLNYLYIGVGGPSPFNPKARGEQRGDELFTNSIVALDANTGEYVWHYQTTPNDAWNFEPVMHMLTADIVIDGRPRHVLMQAPKNGFFYVLDAKTGELLSAKNFVPVNWASGIDSKSGRPVELPDARYYEHADGIAIVWPNPYGAHSWQPMSYNPATRLVYLPAMEMKARWQLASGHGLLGGDLRFDVLYDFEHDKGRLIAWDPISATERWNIQLPSIWNGGVLSTAGDLVFQGTATGDFTAYRATDGSKLWSMRLGSGISASPSTVMADGTQYILLPIGSGAAAISARTLAKLSPKDRPLGPARLVAFKLDGTAHLPAVTASIPPVERPPRARPTAAALIAKGQELYEGAGCDVCHGVSVVALPNGSVPDLRRLPEGIFESMPDIVLNGALSAAGMPSFKHTLTGKDLEAIQAYILDRAWAAYQAQSPEHSTSVNPLSSRTWPP